MSYLAVIILICGLLRDFQPVAIRSKEELSIRKITYFLYYPVDNSFVVA